MPVYRITGQIYGRRITEYVSGGDQAAAEQWLLDYLRKRDRDATVDPAKTKLIHPVEEKSE